MLLHFIVARVCLLVAEYVVDFGVGDSFGHPSLSQTVRYIYYFYVVQTNWVFTWTAKHKTRSYGQKGTTQIQHMR